MLGRRSIGSIALAAALALTLAAAHAFDDAKYPNWKGSGRGSLAAADGIRPSRRDQGSRHR